MSEKSTIRRVAAQIACGLVDIYGLDATSFGDGHINIYLRDYFGYVNFMDNKWSIEFKSKQTGATYRTIVCKDVFNFDHVFAAVEAALSKVL